MKRLLVTALSVIAAAFLAASPGFGRIGESLDKLRDRFGKAPAADSPKGKAVWFIESIDGPLAYTVTLNARGVSIGEGIKPLKRAVLTAQIAQDFVNDQLSLIKDSKTARVVKEGENYTFAGQVFVCEKQEYVVVDEPNDLLVIWSRGGIPTVMAVTREMLRPEAG